MSSASLYAEREKFRDRRTDLLAMPPEGLRTAFLIDGVFGVGVLLGGGFPGAAAVLAILLERELPGVVNFLGGEPT